MVEKKITINRVQELLEEGKKVEVKTKNDEYTNISDFIDKGVLPTYKVLLSDDKSIKVSEDHLFFTNQGWMTTGDLVVGETEVYCDDEEYYTVEEVSHIGDRNIYDITVDHPESCYFGNGMLHHNSGKSLLAEHVLANTQRMGGVSVLIDTENAGNKDFLRTIGLEEDSLLYISENRIEKIFKIIENLIVELRERDSDGFTTIVVDSVAGATTEKELEEDYDKEGYNTDKAIVLSKSMRKLTEMFGRENVLLIFTNQIRANVGGGMFAPDYVVPGGKAIPFHSSVRIRMKDTSKIKEGSGSSKKVVGAELKPEVVKNRLAPPKRKTRFKLRFDSGIQDHESIFEECKNHDIAKHKGAGWFNILLKDDKGERSIKWQHPEEDGEFTFRGKNFSNKLESDSTFRELIFEELKSEVLIDYEDNWVENSDNEFEDETSEEAEEE